MSEYPQALNNASMPVARRDPAPTQFIFKHDFKFQQPTFYFRLRMASAPAPLPREYRPHLTNIPAETREMISQHLFVYAKIVVDRAPRRCRAHTYGGWRPHVLQVCRQIRSEAFPLLCASTLRA